MPLFLILTILMHALPSFANSSLDCSKFFEDNGTEQGGGYYYLKINRDFFSVWHKPYQGQNDSSPATHEVDLIKLKTRNSRLKLYVARKGKVKFEYVSVRNMGVLDITWPTGSSSYKCE